MNTSSPPSSTMSQQSPDTPTQLPAQTRKNSIVCTFASFIANLLLGLTTSIIWQGQIVGASVGGAIVCLLFLLLLIYFKRRQRLRQQALRTGISIYSGAKTSAPAVEDRETSQALAHGTITPFTPPFLLDTPSQLRIPPTKSPPIASLPRQPRFGEQRSAGLRADSEGRDVLVEMMQNMVHIQERLLHLEGHFPGEGDRDRRIRRTSTSRNDENPFEIRSDGTSDAPPTYRE
jgi:hypothetical protein